MRIRFAVIAFFSLCGSVGVQAQAPSSGCELPRGIVRPSPSALIADAGDGSDNTYVRTVGGWTQEGSRFTASFTVPFAWVNRQVSIRIASASAAYEVRVGGRPVASVSDGSQPVEIDVTKIVKEGRNELEIRSADPSPAAAVESWRPASSFALGTVQVLSQPTMRIRDVLVKTWRPTDEGDYTAEVSVVVKSGALNPRTIRLWYELLTPSGRQTVSSYRDLTLDMRREDTVRFLARIPYDSLWSAARPQRYTLRLKNQREGRFEEYETFRIGFRLIETKQGRLFVNGAPVTLRTREISPRTKPGELARLREAGDNALLLRPGTVAPELLEACDTMGLYVIVQAPIDSRRSGDSRRRGGNPSNDPAWQTAFVERAERCYHTTKLHPSVVAFSIARHSANGIALYEAYLALKRYGDPRPVIYPEAAGEWNSDPFHY